MNDLTTPPMTRTHVLQIVGNAIVGGMEKSVASLVERMPAERFSVSVLAPFESAFTDHLRHLGAQVYTTAIAEEPSWQSIQLAAALVQSNKVDVIQSHLPNAHVLAGLVGRLTGRPVLATIHGRTVTTLDIEVQRAAGTHLAVVCRHTFFHALGIGADARHVHFVPNGVDTELFRPRPSRTGALRTRFGIAADAVLVGFVGRLSWEKGPDVFLRMALSVHELRPDVHFVLVGDGMMNATLQAIVARFRLEGVVHFAGMQQNMVEVFNEFDIAVSSSHSEAMPFAVMEAMATGLPVVACKVGGVADLIQHETTGYIANDNDYDGLALRVTDLVDRPAVRAAFGEAGRQRACERFSLTRSVEATATLLARLGEQAAEPRRIGALHEAGRPLRSSGAAVKAAR